jgi:hypothetical protein
MPRWVFLLGVGLLLVAVACALTLELLTPPRLTAASARRVKPGMTLAEVEAVVGVHHHFRPLSRGLHQHIWVSRHGCAWVDFFDATGRVASVQFADADHDFAAQNIQMFGLPPESGPLDALRKALGL